MGNFLRSTVLIAKNFLGKTPGHLCIRGGVQKQAEVIDTVSKELSLFLGKFKGKHITTEQLQEYYREVFPGLNIRISHLERKKDVFGTAPLAATQNPFIEGKYKGYMEMEINSESILDKIKRVFGKNNNDRFYVNSDFVESFIHENTHIMQAYMKPADKVYGSTLKKIAQAEHPHNANEWVNGYGIDGACTYSFHIYKEEWPLLFDSRRFIEEVKSGINRYYNTEEIKLAHMKYFIRSAEFEKQAYEMGELNKLRFKYPKLAKIPFFDNLFKKAASRSTNAFKFKEKIEVMKKEYFRMIEEERSKISGFSVIS